MVTAVKPKIYLDLGAKDTTIVEHAGILGLTQLFIEIVLVVMKNESDKAVFGKILAEFKKQTELESIWIGDSALYSQENLQLMKEMRWITRVPLTIKKARELIQGD